MIKFNFSKKKKRETQREGDTKRKKGGGKTRGRIALQRSAQGWLIYITEMGDLPSKRGFVPVQVD